VIRATPAPKGLRRVARYAAVVCLLVLLSLSALFAYFSFFSVVPPIRARVVDAISRQPIAGVEVTLRVDCFQAWSIITVRTETQTTDSNGEVRFPPSFYRDPGLLKKFEGYSLSVNDESVVARPWRRELYLRPNQNDNYFPIILHHSFPNSDEWRERLWSAPDPATIRLGSWWFVTVPLIPVLDSPDRCSSIASTTLSKQCKELNTYRSAFLHFNSIQDVENNKAICRRLEERAAKTCLDELHAYILNAMTAPPIMNASWWYKPRQMPMVPTAPLEEVLPVDTMGGLEISNRRTCCNDAFTGRVAYLATYQGQRGHRIDIKVENFPTEDGARQAFSGRSSSRFDYNPKSTVSDEMRSGNRIWVYRGINQEIAFWQSASKVITISITFQVPKDEEGISKYLTLYPSSL